MKLLGCVLGIITGMFLFFFFIGKYLVSSFFVLLVMLIALALFVAENYDPDDKR